MNFLEIGRVINKSHSRFSKSGRTVPVKSRLATLQKQSGHFNPYRVASVASENAHAVKYSSIRSLTQGNPDIIFLWWAGDSNRLVQSCCLDTKQCVNKWITLHGYFSNFKRIERPINNAYLSLAACCYPHHRNTM